MGNETFAHWRQLPGSLWARVCDYDQFWSLAGRVAQSAEAMPNFAFRYVTSRKNQLFCAPILYRYIIIKLYNNTTIFSRLLPICICFPSDSVVGRVCGMVVGQGSVMVVIRQGFYCNVFLSLQNQLHVIKEGKGLRVETDKPHLVSLGGGRLSTAVTLLPLPEGQSHFTFLHPVLHVCMQKTSCIVSVLYARWSHMTEY